MDDVILKKRNLGKYVLVFPRKKDGYLGFKSYSGINFLLTKDAVSAKVVVFGKEVLNLPLTKIKDCKVDKKKYFLRLTYRKDREDKDVLMNLGKDTEKWANKICELARL